MKSSRRQFLKLFAAMLGASLGASAAIATDAITTTVTVETLWPTYRSRFVKADGRVIDTGNHGVSHSEGQGWGMLLSAAAGDMAAFDRIWAWTEQNLRWSGAALYAWKWDQRKGVVVDPNDASDGDILIAWALARTAYFTKRGDLETAAKRSAVAVRRLLTDQIRGTTALLPGFHGFERGGAATLNLSYYVFPAFDHIQFYDPHPVWQALARDGVALARQARFGRMQLPPDWLVVAPNGQLSPAEHWPARFGFDAVRIPLYLYWAGYDSTADMAPFLATWNTPDQPAWFALDGGADADFPAPAGFKAIAELIRDGQPDATTLWSAVKEGDYYSASLAMLAALAAEERGVR